MKIYIGLKNKLKENFDFDVIFFRSGRKLIGYLNNKFNLIFFSVFSNLFYLFKIKAHFGLMETDNLPFETIFLHFVCLNSIHLD